MSGLEGWDFNESEYERLLRQADGQFESLIGNVVHDAQSLAPKETGAGAASIHAEFYTAANGLPAARIGPDAEHDYMLNEEFGTVGHAPRPHLRPAATKRRDI